MCVTSAPLNLCNCVSNEHTTKSGKWINKCVRSEGATAKFPFFCQIFQASVEVRLKWLILTAVEMRLKVSVENFQPHG